MSPEEIEKLLMYEDIVPVGKFETVPVTHQLSGEAAAYPNVVMIKALPEHADLVAESKVHVEIIGKRFLKDRASHFHSSISSEDLKKYLADLGFAAHQYQSYSLRKLGTNELEDFVLPVTRKFFEDLGVETFRQQHTLSSNGWNTKIHRDHADFKIHGFRGMVPLNAPVYMGYIGDNNENLIYRLDPGFLYFANIAKPHRGFAVDMNRLAIMFQMASDKLVLEPSSQIMTPITDFSGIPEHMIPYRL